MRACIDRVAGRPVSTVLLTLALVGLLLGCGPKGPAVPAVQGVQPTAPPTPEAGASVDVGVAEPSVSPTADASESSTQAPAASEPGQPTRPSYGPHHNTVFTVRMSTDCVTPGQHITAHMTGPPRASVGMAVMYGRDGESAPGPLHSARTDDAGRYDWTFLVAPTAPPGRADLVAGASGPDGGSEGGGTADATFAVSPGC